jgi:AhpD family alkylhydroperoxidase
MDERIKELIAVGASVTANCQPCLKYHAGEAQKQGANLPDINEAIEVGQMVKKVAMRKFNEFIPTVIKSSS